MTTSILFSDFLYGKDLSMTFDSKVTIITAYNGGGKTRFINTLEELHHDDKVFKLSIDDIINDFNTYDYSKLAKMQFDIIRLRKFRLFLSKVMSKSSSRLMFRCSKGCIRAVSGNKDINMNELSMGEKVLCRLLYNLAHEDYDLILIDCIDQLFHIGIQEEIIDMIVELQPNAQLVYATHSPSTIMRGWENNVKFLGDYLVTPIDETV